MTNKYEYKIGDKFLWCKDTGRQEEVTEGDLVEVVKVTPAGKCRVKRVRDNHEPDYLWTPEGYPYGAASYVNYKLLPYDQAFLMRNKDFQRQKEITQEINSILSELGKIKWNEKYGFSEGDNPCPDNALNYLNDLKEMAIKIRRLKQYFVCEVKRKNGEGTIKQGEEITEDDRGCGRKSFDSYADAVQYLNEAFKKETESYWMSDYYNEHQLAVMELDRDKMAYYKVIYVTRTFGERHSEYKAEKAKAV